MSRTNIREIAFEVTLEGRGVVQRDQSSQQYAYIQSEGASRIDQLGNSNITFAKANYYNNPQYTPVDDNKHKKYLRKIKISGAGLRHALHADVMPFHTPQFFQNPAIRSDILSSMDYILRGYMYAPSNGSADGESIRRASAYVMTDAEEVGGAVSTIELSSTTGERTSTSLFYQETIGDSKYVAKGSIDMAQLQFISASPNADRMALTAEDLIAVSKEMIRKYGAGSIREGYYHLSGATKPLAEKGIILSDELVANMCSYLFEQMSKIYFNKQSAYAKVTNIRIKFISDPTSDFVEDPEDWIVIYNPSNKVRDFDISFEPHHFYEETSLEEIKRHNEIALDFSQRIKATKDLKALEKAASKKIKE